MKETEGILVTDVNWDTFLCFRSLNLVGCGRGSRSDRNVFAKLVE